MVTSHLAKPGVFSGVRVSHPFWGMIFSVEPLPNQKRHCQGLLKYLRNDSNEMMLNIFELFVEIYHDKIYDKYHLMYLAEL